MVLSVYCTYRAIYVVLLCSCYCPRLYPKELHCVGGFWTDDVDMILSE